MAANDIFDYHESIYADPHNLENILGPDIPKTKNYSIGVAYPQNTSATNTNIDARQIQFPGTTEQVSHAKMAKDFSHRIEKFAGGESNLISHGFAIIFIMLMIIIVLVIMLKDANRTIKIMSKFIARKNN